MREGFRRMQQIGLGMGLVALILVLVLQRITVTRSLRPLERARQQIAQLQQGKRSQLDEQVPSELAPLVGQINTCSATPKTACAARAMPWATSGMR